MTNETVNAAAYGGDGWSPRSTSLSQELGGLWGCCGSTSEWSRLKSVLLHRPGEELGASVDPDSVLMIEPLDLARAQAQHDEMAEAYRQLGVTVYYVDPQDRPKPNQMFCADLMFMTPEGAVLARPAGTVRAGEERQVARRLADLGVPIVRSIRGRGTFEGADAMWLNSETVIIGRGMRTNDEGAAQLKLILNEMGVETIIVDLPVGTMHLMGTLRIVSEKTAVARHFRFMHRGVEALQRHGYQVKFVPESWETDKNKAFNFVTVGRNEILMAGNNPKTQSFYESLDVTCHAVPVDELGKAAGAIGCLSGIVERDV